MADDPIDRLDGVIWYDGKLVPWARRQHARADPRPALRQLACSRASAPMAAKSSSAPSTPSGCKRSAQLLDFEIPYSVAEIDAAKRLVLEKNGQTDAYVRPVAWRGSEMMGVSAQNNTIHLAIATWEWPSYFDPVQRLKGIRLDLADYRRPDPATAPARAKAAGPLHDLHHLQAQGRAQRLCRRHDAGLAGPRRRMHRRQHLLHQGRQDPHADRRLLPRRHHPPDRDRTGEEARHRGDRAAHHAGRARAVLRMLHHRHRGGGHGGVRDRAVEIHARRDHPAAAWTTTPPRCSPRARRRRRNAAGKTNPNRARARRSSPRPCARGARRGRRSRRSAR